METMQTDTLLEKQQISQSAISLWMDSPGDLNWQTLEEACGIPESRMRTFFETPDDALFGFYLQCIDQYEILVEQIDGYPSFSLEEQASTFVYMMFDFLTEEKEFVQKTFFRKAMGPAGAEFRTRITEHFSTILRNEDVALVNRLVMGTGVVHQILTVEYLLLVQYWLSDASPNQEKSTALTEKLISLFAEIAGFRGFDKGVELMKYVINADVLGLAKLPFIGHFFKKDATEVS